MNMAESFPKWYETLWEKEKLLLSLHYFQKVCTADSEKQGFIWEGFKPYLFVVRKCFQLCPVQNVVVL